MNKPTRRGILKALVIAPIAAILAKPQPVAKQLSWAHWKHKRYMVTWFVETDDPEIGPQAVAEHPSIPRLYSPYPNDPEFVCKRISVWPVAKGGSLWNVECEFDLIKTC